MIKSLLSFTLVLFLSIGIALNAHAEDTCRALPPKLLTKPLTLIELTDIALSCNPSTRLAWAETKQSLANLGTAYSTLWPELNGTGSLSYLNVGAVKTASAVSNSGSKGELTYGPGISVSYLLWDFGVRVQRIRAADFQVQAARFSQNAAFQQIILQVEQVYYQLIGQKASVVVNLESVRQNQVNLAAAVALREQGMAVIGDVYQAQSALSQAQLNLEQAEGTLKILQGQLALALGVPMQTPLKLASLSEHVKTQDVLESVGELMEYAKENRTDLLAAEADVKAAEATLIATGRQDWPTIELNAGTQRAYSNNNLYNTHTNSVMLTLNIPIFSGFSQKYAVMQAQAQKEQAEAERDILSQQIDLQVWQAYYELKTAAQSIKTSQELLISSIQAAKQAYGQYRAGVGDILSVLTTQVAADNARVQSIQAKLNWYTALAQFSYALGKINV